MNVDQTAAACREDPLWEGGRREAFRRYQEYFGNRSVFYYGMESDMIFLEQ